MNIKNYFIFLFFFIVSIATAQSIEVNGTVTDSKTRQSIPGVNVTIKSSNKGVTTDFDGKYSIKLNSNEILTFSSVGYATQEVKVSKSQTLNISLSEEANKLEEVVINVGYGTQKKKLVTNAISTVRSEAFDDRPITDVGQALQGNAAGVNVVQRSGKPGEGLDIRIRGMSSIQSGNNPLFVIDGVQTYSSEGLNTDDIADIQILKDATATAIYGVNGSAGVVLITTKRGKTNKNSFNFSSYYGTSKIVKSVDVLDIDQYKQLMLEISPTNYYETTKKSIYSGINTNWADKVFQTGIDQNYDFSYSGGGEKIKTFASLGYQDTNGIINPSEFNRLNGRINIDVDAASWLKAHANMNLIHINRDNTSDNAEAGRGGVILSALVTQPFLPVYADEFVGRDYNETTGIYSYPGQPSNTGGYQNGQFAANPVNSLQNPAARQSPQDHTSTYKYIGNLSLDITLLKNLVWKPSSTVERVRSVNEYFIDSYRTVDGRNESEPAKKGFGRLTTNNFYTWNLENTLNYNIKSENHDFTFLLGNGVQKFRFDEDKIEGNGFDESLRELDISQMQVLNTQFSKVIAREKNYVSYFGRATYNLMNKYILNGVFRASGASQLAPGNKWGYFPGISAAWIVSNEDFMKNYSSINELKIRGGWGQTGNVSGLFEYATFALLPLYSFSFTPSTYANPDLTWETTTDASLGIDLGILNNRAKLTVDVFKRRTEKLINTAVISSADYNYNAGTLENKGIELSLNTINFKGENFNWTTNFNISFIKNEVVEMGRFNKVNYYGIQSANRVEINQPLGNFFGYIFEGVNPANGNIIFKDVNGDGSITADDRAIIGNAMPDYTFGLTNTFSYKGFSLDALFTGSQGNDILNATRIDLEQMIGPENQSTAVLDRWTTTNTITDIPRVGDTNSKLVSSKFVEDGSYIRLKSATLGYSFKNGFLGLKSLKLYATGQNLITWTNYSGFDPEVGSSNDTKGVGRGIDYGTYPQVRTFIVGLKAGF